VSADGGTPSLEACAGLSRAVQLTDDDALLTAAEAFRNAPDALLDLLRYLHLFFGFPRVIHALGVLRDSGGLQTSAAAYGAAASAALVAPERDAAISGEDRFRQLYREDADRVLARLEELDPLFRDWILGHAYGATADSQQLPLPLAERIAVLALAATRCWDQCYSHLRVARRNGVSLATLDADRAAADWLDAESQDQLGKLLQRGADSAEA